MTLKELKLGDLGLKFLVVFIILCPIFTYAGRHFGIADLRIGQEQFFQLGITFLFAVAFLENIYFSLFVIWTASLYIYWDFPSQGGNYLMNILWAGILYQITYKIVSRQNVMTIYKAFLALLILNIIWIVFQITGNGFMFVEHLKTNFTNQAVGFMGIKAHMGMLFALGVPIALRTCKPLAVVFLYPIWLSQSSVAVVSAVICILYWFWINHRRYFIVLLIILSLGGGWYVNKDSKSGMMHDRVYLWKVVAQDITLRPFVGWGLDSFRNISKLKNFMYGKITSVDFERQKSARFKYHEETQSLVPPKELTKKEGEYFDLWDNPHNEYISIVYEFGFVPILILLFMIKDIIRRFRNYDYDSVCIMGIFISYAVTSLGQFPFHVARIGYAFPIVLAIYYKLTDEAQKKGYRNG